MKKIFTGCVIALLLAGCSTEKTESLTCKISGSGNGGNPTIQTTYKYTVGDEPKLAALESETTVLFDGEGLTRESQEPIVQAYDESVAEIEGLKHSYEIDDEKIVEHLKIDFTTISEADLKKLDWPYEADSTFDLENFKSNLEVMGYTCE